MSRSPDEEESARLLELAAAGLIKLGRARGISEELWKMPRPRDPRGVVLKALLQERGAGQ